MLKRRLIPVLFLKDGWMVRSETFSVHQYIGDPVIHVERMVDWDVDELIVIDIGQDEMTFEHHRQDYRNRPVVTLIDFIHTIAVECRIPLTFGGRIRTIDDIRTRIQNGADKVCVNLMLDAAPETVTEAAKTFGSQAIVASVDYRIVDGDAVTFVAHACENTGQSPRDWARRAQDLGVGEILLNAVDRDGTARGYDIETTAAVVDAVEIPVIACGGAGHQRHFAECLDKTEASAIAAGNIFHFTENAYPRAKQFLCGRRDDIRPQAVRDRGQERRPGAQQAMV